MRNLFLFIAYVFAITTQAKGEQVKIIINNNLDVQRQELVEVDYATVRKRLHLDDDDAIIVKNAFGQQVDYQITYDGKLLIDVCVRPCGEAEYIVMKGIPQAMTTWVEGKMYPTRKDDIAWENDRGAYRVYGPALQKTGERSFGIDVWTKNTPELDVENRYIADYDGNVKKNKYRKQGKNDLWEKENLATSFHLNHGKGLDCYNVGPSLGCGTPALLDGDRLIMPYCYRDYEILDNGPLRFTVSLEYNPTKIKSDTCVVEHRLISLDKGSNFNKIIVWYDGLKHSRNVAAGVVIHSEDTKSVDIGSDYVLYADPTDSPSRHNFQIYVAALFPDGAETKFLKNTENAKGIEGHAVGIMKNMKEGKRFSYYFGSAWSCYDVRNINQWRLCVTDFLEALRNPLDVEIR